MKPAQFPFPMRLDANGRLQNPDWPHHVDEMVRQVLLTTPGERVNRPDFGTGLLAMVFAPIGPSTAALEVLVQTSLARWLGTVIEVTSVSVTTADSTLQVAVAYTLRATHERRTVTVTA